MIYSKMDHVFNSKICLVSHSGDKKTKNEKMVALKIRKGGLDQIELIEKLSDC